MKNYICFGEILWDGLLTGKTLGGAPLNLALRLQSFGNDVKIISRIGNDELGDEILKELKFRNFDYSQVQIDEKEASGYVDVFLDEKGSASYNIRKPVAWDFIELNKQNLELVNKADAFIFGSLACRNEISKRTLFELLSVAQYKIFDINLRSPHYDFKTIHEMMEESDIIKMNDEELYIISDFFNSPYQSLEKNIVFISEKVKCNKICITKGKHGAVFYENEVFYYNSGFRINVKDTIGAGDSFLATFIHFYLKGTEITKSLEYACAMGALVSSNEGANPVINEQYLLNFVNGTDKVEISN